MAPTQICIIHFPNNEIKTIKYQNQQIVHPFELQMFPKKNKVVLNESTGILSSLFMFPQNTGIKDSP